MYKITYKQREYKNGRLVVSEYETRQFALPEWNRFKYFYRRANHRLGPNDAFGDAKIIRL